MALFYFCSENGTSGESNQIPPLNADREVVRTHTPLFLYICVGTNKTWKLSTQSENHTHMNNNPRFII